MFHIYALVDPRDSQTRYLGVTAHAKRRLRQHASGGTTATRQWSRELRSLGMRPVMIVLQLCETAQKAAVAEDYWIRHFLSLKANLLNNKFKRGGLKGTCVL